MSDEDSIEANKSVVKETAIVQSSQEQDSDVQTISDAVWKKVGALSTYHKFQLPTEILSMGVENFDLSAGEDFSSMNLQE